MHERIQEHDRNIQLSRTQTSAVFQQAIRPDIIRFGTRLSVLAETPSLQWYSRRVKEAIRIRLHPYNINRDSEIEILEAWMPKMR